MNFVPLLLIGTVPIVLLLTAPFLGTAVAILRARTSKWPPGSAWLIPLGVATVGTLPGMVGVHRNLLGWHSYLDHLPFSLACLVAISTVAVSRAQLKPDLCGRSLCQALIAASVVNAAFPWWPLD